MGSTFTTQIPFLGDIYELLCFSWTHTEDLFKASLLAVVSLCSYAKSLLLRSVRTRQSYVYDSLLSSNHSSTLKNPQNLTGLSLTRGEIQNSTPLEVMYKLAQASKSLKSVNVSAVTVLGRPHTYATDVSIFDSLSTYTTQPINTLNLLSVSSTEYGYTAIPHDAQTIQLFDTESADLNNVSTYNTALSTTNLNTQDALRNAKQDR